MWPKDESSIDTISRIFYPSGKLVLEICANHLDPTWLHQNPCPFLSPMRRRPPVCSASSAMRHRSLPWAAAPMLLLVSPVLPWLREPPALPPPCSLAGTHACSLAPLRYQRPCRRRSWVPRSPFHISVQHFVIPIAIFCSKISTF